MKKTTDKPVKKPLWPIYLIFLLLVAIAVVLFKDWKRYPSASELEGYLKLSYSTANIKIIVTNTEEIKDEDDIMMVYHLDYILENGEVKKDSYSIRDENKKSVYPWHNYYRTETNK